MLKDSMDATDEVRRETARRRQSPGQPVPLTATFAAGCDPTDENCPVPTKLTIETTNEDGETAEWLDDAWWAGVIRIWGAPSVTLHVAPTPCALLHPIVLHHMEMVSRVLPRWRIVGQAYRDDVITDEAVEALAQSPYHEVRFVDQRRPMKSGSDRFDMTPPLEELFARIRREQARVASNRPILVRLPAPSDEVEQTTHRPSEQRVRTSQRSDGKASDVLSEGTC